MENSSDKKCLICSEAAVPIVKTCSKSMHALSYCPFILKHVLEIPSLENPRPEDYDSFCKSCFKKIKKIRKYLDLLRDAERALFATKENLEKKYLKVESPIEIDNEVVETRVENDAIGEAITELTVEKGLNKKLRVTMWQSRRRKGLKTKLQFQSKLRVMKSVKIKKCRKIAVAKLGFRSNSNQAVETSEQSLRPPEQQQVLSEITSVNIAELDEPREISSPEQIEFKIKVLDKLPMGIGVTPKEENDTIPILGTEASNRILVNQSGKFTCKTCSSNFHTSESYQAHIQIHKWRNQIKTRSVANKIRNRKRNCGLCGIKCISWANLATHVENTHTTSCKICGKKFQRKSNLARHRAVVHKSEANNLSPIKNTEPK